VTRYDLFRRRIAPIAFGLAIAGMAWQSCHKHQQTHATFVLDLGAAAADVRAVDAELWIDGGEVAQFHRNALDGHAIGAVRFEAVLPASDGELRIDVDLRAGHRHVVRSVHAVDGGTVTVPLEADLR
jgi:hypothetical protein